MHEIGDSPLLRWDERIPKYNHVEPTFVAGRFDDAEVGCNYYRMTRPLQE